MLLTMVNLVGTLFLFMIIDTGNASVLSSNMESFNEFNSINQGTHRKTPKAVTFSLAKHFNNHMVLQKAPAKANIYGFSSSIGAEVFVSMIIKGGKTHDYKTRVTNGTSEGVGQWTIVLDPMKAGTEVAIIATSGDIFYNLIDVIFGDIWICSGQSNMEFTTIQMNGAAEEIADAHNYPNIRLMAVDDFASDTPLEDLHKIMLNWSRPSNESVGGPAWQYFSAVCWLYGKAIHKALGYPIGLVATDWGGTPVEAWSSPEALAQCGANETVTMRQSSSSLAYLNVLSPENNPKNTGPDNNSNLWNAMIYPFLKMTIYGAIWYQGEADASGIKMNRYNCTFPTMIKDWRLKFHAASGKQTNPSFPFGFVQLAPNSPDQTITVGFPDIRWHQTADYGYVPNPKMSDVFFAVAMDLPDFNSTYGSIHPRDKIDVGYRLGLSGLAVAYKKAVNYRGPFPSLITISPHNISILYVNDTTLEIRNVAGFELHCPTNEWVATLVTSSDSSNVVFKSGVCPKAAIPIGIRYAWRESPCEFKKCAVYDKKSGLPGPPFSFTWGRGTGQQIQYKFV